MALYKLILNEETSKQEEENTLDQISNYFVRLPTVLSLSSISLRNIISGKIGIKDGHLPSSLSHAIKGIREAPGSYKRTFSESIDAHNAKPPGLTIDQAFDDLVRRCPPENIEISYIGDQEKEEWKIESLGSNIFETPIDMKNPVGKLVRTQFIGPFGVMKKEFAYYTIDGGIHRNVKFEEGAMEVSLDITFEQDEVVVVERFIIRKRETKVNQYGRITKSKYTKIITTA